VAESVHRAEVVWSGGDEDDVRAHEVLLGAQTLETSTAEEFGGDPSKANPERMLAGGIAACHMLFFLALARKRGFEVDSYEDDAEVVLDGKRFTSATLRPRVRWRGDPPDPEAIEAMHHRSHDLCFIANSVNFPVEVEPQ
jgi:organic hydroperoxide reductase OsmC/OhrA